MDTSALLAFLDRDDPEHQRVQEAFDVVARTDDLLTHAYVVSETLGLVRRRLGVEAVRALIDEVFPIIATLMVDEPTHQAGLAALSAALPTKVSFVDFVSFEVMRDRSIGRALALDADFAKAGFRLAP